MVFHWGALRGLLGDVVRLLHDLRHGLLPGGGGRHRLPEVVQQLVEERDPWCWNIEDESYHSRISYSEDHCHIK